METEKIEYNGNMIELIRYLDEINALFWISEYEIELIIGDKSIFIRG